MRIGLIADIHGNLIALDTVLAALARERVDELICLGDVAALGPQPGEVIARLRALGCPVVMGNTDAWLLDPPSPEGAAADNRSNRILNAWCAAQLTDADRAYVRAFPPTLERPIRNGKHLLCFHGSPQSFDDVIVATTPDDDLRWMLDGSDATIMAGGHTHIAMLRRVGDGTLINPGSVGLPGTGAILPYNRDVHWAEYAVLDVDSDRHAITLHRISLDVATMLNVARARGMPEYDYWAAKWRAPQRGMRPSQPHR
ncbi:MAG: metallophosphoesterase family protein [Thermomicrobiales bacterium]